MMRKTGFFTVLLVVLVIGLFVGAHYVSVRPSAGRQVLYYEDPMHPKYHSAVPGIAPDCGMELVAVYAEDLGHVIVNAELTKPGTVHIDSLTRQLYGIQVSQVKQDSGQNMVHVYGKVAADETRTFRIDLGTEGYVKETSGDAVGNHVIKNQHLALIYSPDFLSVAGGYLSATERTPSGPSKDAPSSTLNASGSQARADRLRNLGMSDVQIEEIGSTRKIPEDIYVVSPTDGFILSRDISPGMRFEKHAELYRIADLRHVWVLAEAFGKDALAFKPSALARVLLPDTGESFKARVSSVLPQLDPVTQTLKPRLEIANPSFHLRPGMFVDVELNTAEPTGLSVPADAIVNTGRAKRVFVETSEGNFEVREVQTGWSDGERVQIVHGLNQGEQVISAGTFLIDSESRMHQPLSLMH